MTLDELISENLILKARVGSYLYGTNTADSDEDYVGIFVPNKEYLLGLNRVEEVLNLSDEMESKVECLYEITELPPRPNRKLIEQFVINTHREYIL